MWRAVLVFAAAFLGARSASAAEPGPRYALSWVRGPGAESCPDARALSRDVERRLQRTAFDGASAMSLEVQVTRGPSGLQSQVFLRDERGAPLGERTLFGEGEDCESLFAATALAIALIIDPDAPLGARESEPPVEPPSGGVVPSKAEVAAPRVRPSSAALAVRDQLSVDDVRELEDGMDLSGQGALAFGVVPGSAFGAVLAGEMNAGRWGLIARGLYLSPGSVSVDGAAFRVGLTAFGLGASWNTSIARVRWAFDAGPWFGAFHVAVRAPVPAGSSDLLFVAASAGTRLEVRLGSGIFALAGANLFVPLVRRGLFVEGAREPVWRQAPVSAVFSSGLGMSVP